MKIDRAKFLFLAGAIAASACGKGSVADKDPDGGAGSGGETDGGGGDASGGSGGAAGGGAGGTGGDAGQSSGGAAGAAGEGGGGAGGACDDSEGSPSDCSPVGDIGGCGEFGEDFCNAAVANLKPRLAEQAVTCMLGVDDTCGGPPYECMVQALDDACPDASANEDCDDFVAACSPNEALTDAECHDMIDGLNATGRAAVRECVEDGCTFGLWSCIEGL